MKENEGFIVYARIHRRIRAGVKGRAKIFLGRQKSLESRPQADFFVKTRKLSAQVLERALERRKFLGFSSKIASFWAILSLSRGAETLF